MKHTIQALHKKGNYVIATSDHLWLNGLATWFNYVKCVNLYVYFKILDDPKDVISVTSEEHASREMLFWINLFFFKPKKTGSIYMRLYEKPMQHIALYVIDRESILLG